MIDPLAIEMRLQREGFFLGDQAGRDAYAERLAKHAESEHEVDLLIDHFRDRARHADDWRGVMVAATRADDSVAGVLADLRAVARHNPKALPSGLEQNRSGFLRICGHGRDRLREGCHSCEPIAYCPHNINWNQCEDRDCVAACDAYLRDFQGAKDSPMRSKAEHFLQITRGTA